jgi:hypothetical protein
MYSFEWCSQSFLSDSIHAQVCGDAMVVPTACVDLEKIVPAPAYQVAEVLLLIVVSSFICD